MTSSNASESRTGAKALRRQWTYASMRATSTSAPVRDSDAFELVILDCPPSLGILTINALAAADGVLIPMQCEYYAMEGLSVVIRLIEQIRQNGTNPTLGLEGVVMTMYDGRTRLSEQVVTEVRGHFPEHVYPTVIPRSVRLSEAPSFGLPVSKYDPSSTGAVAYRRFAREFLKRMRQRHAAPAPVASVASVAPPAPVPPTPEPAVSPAAAPADGIAEPPPAPPA